MSYKYDYNLARLQESTSCSQSIKVQKHGKIHDKFKCFFRCVLDLQICYQYIRL